MGNYFEADIVAKINNKAPKELMDKLVDMSVCYWMHKEIKDGPFIQVSPMFTKDNYKKWDEFEIDYALEDKLSDEAKKFITEMGVQIKDRYLLTLKLEDYSIHEAYILHITCCTKHYYESNVEQKILDLVEELKPYRDHEFNYLGEIKDEDFTYRKEIYWDYEEFEQAKKDREFVCKDCNQPHENALCEYFDGCKRAYNLGYRDASRDATNEIMGVE